MDEYRDVILFFIAIFILKVIATIIILINNNKQIYKENNIKENYVHEIVVTSKPQYNKEVQQSISEDFIYPYHRVQLLTKAEWRFYQNLKNITKPKGYDILTKIRLADLVNVNSGLSNSEWARYFGKIKSKHIDFAIHSNMRIICLIELDDYTHRRIDRQERDEFVDTVLKQTGYEIIHTYGDPNSLKEIEEKISK